MMDDKKDKAAAWFSDLQGQIITAFEALEPNGARFELKPWDRADADAPNESGSVLQGGGTMAIMRGDIFEKVGVNISKVHGVFSKDFAAQIPGADDSNGAFWASGISLVAHMRSPLVPAVHMNTRMICTSKSWFGGGADLTPMFEDFQDTKDWHAAFQACCNQHDGADYQGFKEWCDRYFYLPHRGEPRGIGGIFYDYLENDWDADFAFTQDVGRTFIDIYVQIVKRHMHKEWTAEQREAQLIKRGRYVEFNLLYDRGTMFGLKTGGNTEAILMSMPPEVKWS
jgi:coproporphyrinogen III oxidase